jgi:hypothetical protein
MGCYSGLDGRGNGGAAEQGSDGTADDTGVGDEAGTGADDGVDAEFEPAPVRLRLLLARQYVRTVRDLLGEASSLAVTPPDDVAINGFDAVGASQLSLTDAKVDAFEASARAAAAAADATMLAAHHACAPTGPSDEACLREFVTSFGRLAFRRSLITEEQDSYVAVGLAAATDLGDFDLGVRTVVAAMLQSPNFLYQVEVGEPGDVEGRRRLTGIEMATRLSFFLRDSTPDAELLDLAEAGALDDADGVREVAWTLVESPDTRLALADFAAEVFRIRELETVPKDPTVFPTFTPELAAAMGNETRALVTHLAFDADADFRDLFDADFTFVDAQLAAHYGLPNPEQYTTPTQVVLPPEQLRGGLFGHAGLLSVLGHVTTTSPTYRGKFIRTQVLCQDIPAPPVGVDTTLPSIQVAVSKRIIGSEGPTLQFLSHQGPDSPLSQLFDPREVWNQLFGSFSVPDDPTKPHRIASLDAVKADVERLKLRVGNADKIRLDAHLASVEQIRSQIDALAPLCEIPEMTQQNNDDIEGQEQLEAVNRAMTDLIVMAFTCDVTRIASVQFTGSVGYTVFNTVGATQGHHDLTHDGGMNDMVDAATSFTMQQLAVLLEALQATPEGAGNLLDNSVLLASSDAASGLTHSTDDMPILVCGGGGGTLTHPGIHYHSPSGENTSDVLLAILKSVVPEATEVGSGNGYSNTPLAALLA